MLCEEMEWSPANGARVRASRSAELWDLGRILTGFRLDFYDRRDHFDRSASSFSTVHW
jgi:hypothetical protein